VKHNVWRIDFCGADTWALRTADQKFLGSFEIWYWRRMEKITWTNRVKNEEAFYRVKWVGVPHNKTKEG
jgi:hypothetical protein